MTLQRALTALRLLFLALTVACVATRVVWVVAPAFVDRIDSWVVWTSLREPRALVDEARGHIGASEWDAALEKLLAAAQRTSGVRHGDRAEPARVDTLRMLVREYRRRGEPGEALRWAEVMHQLDSRHVPAELERAQLMHETGDREGHAALLESLARVAGDRPVLQRARMESLLREQRAGDIVRILVELADEGPLGLATSGWELRWVDASGAWLGPLRLELVPAGDAFVATAALPGGPLEVRRLRLDAPRESSFVMTTLQLSPAGADGAPLQGATLTLEDVHRSKDLTVDDARVLADGRIDPYLIFETGPGFQTTTIELSLELAPYLDPRIAELLRSPTGREARALLAAELGAEALQALEAALD